EAARLARVARDLRDAALVVVELLERHDRQKHVVLLEPERLVGSCIRTLVSRTNSLVPDCEGFTRREVAGFDADARAAAGPGSGCRSVGFNKGENLLSVARDLDAPPFAPDHAIAVEDEGAAFDAAHLLPVHVL